MDKLQGSMETLSSFQITEDMKGLDAQSKTLLHSREVLAVILQGAVKEYKGYTCHEIMDFIEADSISETTNVSTGRTNTVIRGSNTEFTQLNEKASNFDVLLKSKNPILSDENILVNLHIDMEPQKTYSLPYPIEKRGIYYLARRISSQLSLVTENTDYGQLEKCYSIWICRDDIPKNERYSISTYEIVKTKDTAESSTPKENYDLMTLVLIKLGDRVYNGKKEDENYNLLNFLNIIMYSHNEDFIERVSEYIDFSENEELWKEASGMFSFGQCVYEDGIKEGIRALVRDNLEDNIPRERSIKRLQKHFSLTQAEAEEYYDEFASDEQKI